jgi:hypothetical protein
MMLVLALLLAAAPPATAPAPAKPAQAAPAAAEPEPFDDRNGAIDPAVASLVGSDDEAVNRGFTRFRKTIPTQFQGVYRKSLGECGAASENSLTIRPTRLYFASSEADVQRVRVEGDRKIVVTSIYDGNGGEIWEKTETILLGKEGRSIAFQRDSGPDTRVRCPKG